MSASLTELLKRFTPEELKLINNFSSKTANVPFYDTKKGLKKINLYQETMTKQEELKKELLIQEWLRLLHIEHILFSISWEVRKYVNKGTLEFSAIDDWRIIEDENRKSCKCHPERTLNNVLTKEEKEIYDNLL